MVWPWRGFVDWVSDEVDVGGRLSVVLAEVKEVHVTVKGHGHRFIANSPSDLLDQFLLRTTKEIWRHSWTYGTCFSKGLVEWQMKTSVRYWLVSLSAAYTHHKHTTHITNTPYTSQIHHTITNTPHTHHKLTTHTPHTHTSQTQHTHITHTHHTHHKHTHHTHTSHTHLSYTHVVAVERPFSIAMSLHMRAANLQITAREIKE
jgi:hypothetical protein